jgi:hypothetical protein
LGNGFHRFALPRVNARNAQNNVSEHPGGYNTFWILVTRINFQSAGCLQSLKKILKLFKEGSYNLGMNNLNFDDVTFADNTDFWATMAKLDAEIKRFEVAVEDFCEAKKEFLANL